MTVCKNALNAVALAALLLVAACGGGDNGTPSAPPPVVAPPAVVPPVVAPPVLEPPVVAPPAVPPAPPVEKPPEVPPVVVVDPLPVVPVTRAMMAPYIVKAQQATCANFHNRLYIVDQKYAFWSQAGYCGRYNFSEQLFALPSQKPLCEFTYLRETAPAVTCTDDRARALFDALIQHYQGDKVFWMSRPVRSYKQEEVMFLPTDGSGIPFYELASTATSGVPTARTVVIEDKAALASLVTAHGLQAQVDLAPEVDFSTHMVLGVFLGFGNCGDARINRVAVKGERMVVEYEQVVTKACVGTPMQLVSIKRIPAPIDFSYSMPAHIAFTEVHRSTNSSHLPHNLVIKDAIDWEKYRLALGDYRGPLPEIDFAKDMVIAVFGRDGPDLCHDEYIDSVYRVGAIIAVNSVHLRPDLRPDRACATAISSPVHIVRLPRSDDAVQFSVRIRYR